MIPARDRVWPLVPFKGDGARTAAQLAALSGIKVNAVRAMLAKWHKLGLAAREVRPNAAALWARSSGNPVGAK